MSGHIPKPHKKRADAAFGMHVDFHARHDQKNVGVNADPQQIDALLRRVRPDFLQCDTKGHFGYSSYPTAIGIRSPAQQGDILQMWRDCTLQNDVALYAHHSSIWDEATAREHPEWAIVDENGVVSERYLSIFSPYLQERLIPQMKELAQRYCLDGVWIDGDCWCMRLDYSKWAQDAYHRHCALSLPREGDAPFPQYLTFLRERFLLFVKTYCDALHEASPTFEIASNYLMGPEMPIHEAPPVDFLSADVHSLRSLRLTARIFAQQGKPWDIMSWAMAHSTADVAATDFYLTMKELPQLCQEAALVLSLGGGYQFFEHPIIDHTYAWAVPRWEQLAAFCRSREPFCFKARPIPQAGVFYSALAVRQSEPTDMCRVFPVTKVMHETIALLNALIDNQFSTEVLLTHRVETDEALSAFGLIALPDMTTMEASAKARLLAYARDGGSLLLAGPNALALFADELGIVTGPVSDPCCLYIEHGDEAVAVRSRFCEPSGEYTVTGRFFLNPFLQGEAYAAMLKMTFGKGTIVALPFSIADDGIKPTAGMRRFVGAAAHHAWPRPAIRVTGSAYVEVTLMEKNGRCCINLTNTLSGARFFHEGTKVMTFDEIPPLHNIGVEIDWPIPPREVIMEPGHVPAPYSYENGTISLVLDVLEIHSVVTVR